ncbi:S-layer homology domain-containing protein, partial [Rothia mucilaginosa]|uniref:S-layer homology domain-containing protein n=1 Tax=Rothia mucilaginosa TaxID=43675 RepID=UPI0026ECC791
TLSVRIDPSKLEKTRDPAADATQNATDYYTGVETVPAQYRQYIASASGRLILAEDNGQNLRVPIHVAPKPVSTMHAADRALTFSQKPSNDKAQKADTSWRKAPVTLKGTEVNQGGYRSLLGAFEYGASVDRVAPTSLSVNSNVKANLQYVGASSDAPALKAAGGNADDGTLRFGISTWANWDVVSYENTFTVEIDTDGNNRADYKLVTDRAKGLDYPLVRLYGYKNGSLVELAYYPLNGAWGDVDTNMMDTNTLVMGAPLKDLGLTSANNSDIQYRVSATTQYEWGNVSETGWIKYRPFSPKLWFSGDSSAVPGLFPDAPGSSLTAHRSSDALPALGESGTPAKALLLHLHNGTGDLSGTNGATGDRAEVLNVKEHQDEYTTPSRFSDVKSGDQFYTEISWLAQRRITTGYPDGTYRPLESVERGAMAAFFYRMAGSPQFTAPSTPSFSDVPTTHPFYKEIEWMKARGITTGWPDGTYRPNAPVNRDAMAAFFYRYAGSPHVDLPATSPFKDVPADSQFYREITWLASTGISTGWPDGTYRPVTPIARDAMAAFIYRYSEKVANLAGR